MSDVITTQSRFKISWLLGVLAAFLIFAIIATYSARMSQDYEDYDQVRAQNRLITLEKLRKEEGTLLNPVDDKGNPTAKWVDQDKGIVRIPIEEAMTREIDTLKAKPPAVGAEMPGMAPAAPAPSSAGINAAPAASAPGPATASSSGNPAPAATNAAPATPDQPVKSSAPASAPSTK